MKKFRERVAEKAGFTLVELIVVIAILGILAAVAVPTYTGYIAKARQAADMQSLSSVATAVVGLAAGDGETVSKIEVSSSGGVTVTLEDADAVKPSATEIADLTGTLTWSEKFGGAVLDYSADDVQWVITYSD